MVLALVSNNIPKHTTLVDGGLIFCGLYLDQALATIVIDTDKHYQSYKTIHNTKDHPYNSANNDDACFS